MEPAQLQTLLKNLMGAVNASTKLPSPDDFKFYATSEAFSAQRARLTAQTQRIIEKLMHKLMPVLLSLNASSEMQLLLRPHNDRSRVSICVCAA